MSNPDPFYLDWKFWSAIVALAALILSQLPPIYTLVKRARLEVEAYSRIHLTHKVGNPNARLHLIVTNSGGRTIRVKRITLGIKRDGKEIAVLPAQGYYQKLEDTSTVLFTGITLKSKEDWAHTILFVNLFDRPDDKRYRDAEALLIEDIRNKRKLSKNKDKLVEADQKHFAMFLRMFDEKFVWLPGEYELRISVECSDRRADVSTAHRFTLFESDSNTLSNSKKDYKFGDGIYWDSINHPGVYVQIVEA